MQYSNCILLPAIFLFLFFITFTAFDFTQKLVWSLWLQQSDMWLISSMGTEFGTSALIKSSNKRGTNKLFYSYLFENNNPFFPLLLRFLVATGFIHDICINSTEHHHKSYPFICTFTFFLSFFWNYFCIVVISKQWLVLWYFWKREREIFFF